MEIGDTHQAIMYYEKLLALQHQLQGEEKSTVLPDYWTIDLRCALHLNLSIAYKGIGNVHQAIEHARIYEKLVSNSKSTRKLAEAQSHKNVGMLNEILGNFEESLSHYKKFLLLSKRQGDKKGTAQAYGCIGSIYAALSNAQLSITHHQQHINNATKMKDKHLVTLAYEQMGDSYMLLENYNSAAESFINMLRSCLNGDPELQATALCKIGTAYRAGDEKHLGLFYFQQSHAISDDFGFQTVKVVSEYNIALLLQNSSVVHELDCSHKYFERLIHIFEAKIQQHRDEETYCSPELMEQLHRCYLGIQGVMVKLDEKEDCLVFAESFKKKYLCQLMVDSGLIPSGITGLLSNHMAAYDMWTFDRIKRVVTQQNATVIFFSVLPKFIITWMIKPGEGLAFFYVKKMPDNETPMNKYIMDLIQKIRGSVDLTDVGYRCENRALPKMNSELETLRAKNKQLSSEQKEKTDDDTDENKNTKPPQRLLYELLFSAMDSIFLDFRSDSSIVIIPDQELFFCPFSTLTNYEGKSLSERFHITVVSSLFALDRCHQNEINFLKSQDELEFDRRIARHGAINKLQNLSAKKNIVSNKNYQKKNNILNMVDVSKIDPKKTSYPHLAKAGVLNRRDLNQMSLSRESTFAQENLKKSGSSLRQPPETISRIKSIVPNCPTAIEKMAGVHTLSTLTTKTSTGTVHFILKKMVCM